MEIVDVDQEPPMYANEAPHSGIRNADDEEPRFDDSKCHDVVARCKNGTVTGRSTAPIHVIIRINLNGRDTDADVMGYSYSPDLGLPYMELIAAKDAFNVFWDYRKNGSPCFDPIRDDGSERPLPSGRFMMWDEFEDDLDGMPKVTLGSITLYEAADPDTDPTKPDSHKPFRRYKFMTAQPTINDYMAIETVGDRKFIQ